MRVGIVVDDEVDGLDVVLGGHRQVALDDHRHDPPVLGHDRHVERDVARADGPVAEQVLQDPGDLLVGHLGVARSRPSRGRRRRPRAWPMRRSPFGTQQAHPGEGDRSGGTNGGSTARDADSIGLESSAAMRGPSQAIRRRRGPLGGPPIRVSRAALPGGVPLRLGRRFPGRWSAIPPRLQLVSPTGVDYFKPFCRKAM